VHGHPAMAHRDQSTSDLSLRHLPDVSQSNASLSFEIPLIVNSADLLLADNSDDFLRGVDSSLTTPPPPKRILDSPLTLSELTPTPRAAHVAGIPIPSLHQRNTKSPEISRARHSPQKTPQSFARILSDTPNLVPSPVNAVRFANLRAEIDSLGRDSAEEADPSNHTVTQVRTAKAPAARLKRGEKLRKGDDRKPKIKAVCQQVPCLIFYLPSEFRLSSRAGSPKAVSRINCHGPISPEPFPQPRGNPKLLGRL